MNEVFKNRWLPWLWSAIVAVLLAGAMVPALAGEQSVAAHRVLFVGPSGHNQYIGLERLAPDADITAVKENELGQINLFSYGTIFVSSYSNRNFLANEPVHSRLLEAIERGAVLVAFRSYGGGLAPPQDLWLPSPATKDGAYQVGEILEPEHPIFNEPHEITLDMLLRVHSGVMYHPYVNLGEGWIPLVGGHYLMPFFRNDTGVPPYDGQPHYGIIELPYGKGRILLVQMIPDHQWFNNDGGRDTSVGRLFMENIVRYALDSSRTVVIGAPEAPAAYVEGGLGAVLDWVERPTPFEMTLELWHSASEGDYVLKWDDRDIITIRHAEVPAKAGSYARISRVFPLDKQARGSTLLTFYLTDDYQGGMDRFYEGDRMVGEAPNMKAEHRFVEVALDGEKIWEEDLLGPNPFPWPHRLRTIDVTDLVRDKEQVEVSITVVDRQSTEDPFWSEVFVSRVALLESIPSIEKAGRIEVPVDGLYLPAVKVTDVPGKRSGVSLHRGEEELLSFLLSADDLKTHWAIGKPVQLKAGELIALSFDANETGDNDERVHNAYLIPERFLAGPDPELVDVRSWFIRDFVTDYVVLQVKGPEGVDLAAPVSHGIPLAKGSLNPDELDRLYLVDADGHSVPMQARSLAQWPDGSVKWVLVSFIGQPGEYVLHVGKEAQPQSQHRLIETLGEHRFRVDTGRLQLTLDVVGSPRIGEAFIDGKAVDLNGVDFSLTYAGGRRLSLADSRVEEIRLLENGSERAVMWVRGRYLSDGNPDLEYTLQWRFYRDQPLVWIDATFTNRLGRKVDLADIRFAVAGDFGPTLGVPLQSAEPIERISASEDWTLIQANEHGFKAFEDGAETISGRRFPGWVVFEDDGRGLFFAGVRHFWEQYPKSVSLTGTGLEFGLWAVESGLILEVADGFQKTHELVLGRVENDLQAQARAALLSQPYVLGFDAEYLAGTGALGIMAPASSAEYPPFRASYEASVEEAYTAYLRQRESRGEYGMHNFGDTTFSWGWGPSYIFWSNQEYDHHYGFLMQYLRSGDIRFWQIGDQAARHYRDIDVIHHSTNPLIVGAPRSHNTKHVVADGWYPDHNLGGVAVHHAWVEGLWLHYLLTGDELTYEAARGAADWFAAEVERDRWYRGGVERGPGWTMVALMGSYRATSDEKYLKAAQVVADDVYLRQDPIRGVYSVPVDGRPSYEGGQAFMSGILSRGMARLYVETGDPRAALATARFYDWLTREMRVAPRQYIYKQAPGWHSPNHTDQIASLLTYGLALHDRRSDWPMVKYDFDFKANPRSMSWMPEALAIFERLYGSYVPLEIVQPDTRSIMVGREGSAETTLTLARLVATEAVEGVLEPIEMPEGISISPERVPYRLEAGQDSLTCPIVINVAPTVSPRRCTFTLGDPEREDVSVTIPVSVPSWTILDTFREPVANTWFGELYSRPTEAESAGWEHIVVDEIDRLRRKGSNEEYLLYDTPGLFEFTLTLYAPEEAMARMEDILEIGVVSADGAYETIPWAITWEEGPPGEYAKGVVTPRHKYAHGDVKLRIVLRAGSGPDWPEFERLDIRGWR